MARSKGAAPVKQDYKFIGILYPDSESYDYFQVCESIKTYFQKWAFVVHDKDINTDGTPKKTHVHWYGRCQTEAGKDSPRPLSSVAVALGLKENEIEYAKSEKASVRYLIHADDDDKAQYSISTIEANFNLLKFFKDKAMNMKSKRIYDYIIEERPLSMAALMGWIFEKDLYAEFRRGFAMWDALLREVIHDA